MLSTCVNRLSLQTISRVPAVCLPLLGGQNGGEGDNMRVRLRLVGPSRCAADSTAQDYHQAAFIRPHNTIADPAPSPTALPAQHQLNSFRGRESHGAGTSTFNRGES
jgi:hypothetical protein